MKTMKYISICMLFSFLGLQGFAQSDRSFLKDVQITGYLGMRIDDCIKERILAQDLDHIIEPFRHKIETSKWQSEFWGKWMIGACDAYKYTRNEQLMEMINHAVKELLKTQLPNGYIGNYSPDVQLAEWDVWGRKYSMLGLQAYYSITHDKKALDACRKMADHLMTQVGPGLVDIATVGNYRGLAAGSVLEPIVQLYNYTKDQRYLDFATYIVQQWETERGPQLITKALQNIPVGERFLPVPKASQWTLNGHKSYEMMSCYVGLLELYKVTHNPGYLSAVEMTVNQIIDEEITITGGASATECFWNGRKNQTTPAFLSNETCVTTTWMQLCDGLFQITGNPCYIDQLEITAYNALQASMKSGGTHIASYVPLEGFRRVGERQCGLDINCCEANGPRGFAMLPHTFFSVRDNTIAVNLYAAAKSVMELNGKNTVEIIQHTDYPVTDEIEISIHPKKETFFDLALRIPLWSKTNRLFINGVEETVSIIPGNYLTVSRQWRKGDKITLKLDLTGRMINLNNCLALLRGPVVLARDSRFQDGFVDETIAVEHDVNNLVQLEPLLEKPDFAWMAFSISALTGIYSQDKEYFRKVKVCDFGSAGNTWDEKQRYRVWLTKTIEVADRDSWW